MPRGRESRRLIFVLLVVYSRLLVAVVRASASQLAALCQYVGGPADAVRARDLRDRAVVAVLADDRGALRVQNPSGQARFGVEGTAHPHRVAGGWFRPVAPEEAVYLLARANPAFQQDRRVHAPTDAPGEVGVPRRFEVVERALDAVGGRDELGLPPTAERRDVPLAEPRIPPRPLGELPADDAHVPERRDPDRDERVVADAVESGRDRYGVVGRQGGTDTRR